METSATDSYHGVGTRSADPRIKVGDWEVQPKALLIKQNGGETKLSPRAMDVLVYLVERAGETVTHDELLEAFWRGPVSSANSVHKTVAELRHALEDDPQAVKHIVTVPKRGYRLIAAVERHTLPTTLMHVNGTQNGSALAAVTSSTGVTASAKQNLGALAAAGLVASILIAGLAWWVAHGDTLEAEVITIGSRSAILLPVSPGPNADNPTSLLQTIQAGVIGQARKWASVSVRSVSLSPRAIKNSNVAGELGVDYAVQIDMQEVGSRLQATLTIAPASNNQLSHREHFDVATADRMTLVKDLISHASEDLGVLMDERAVKQMSEWGTTNVDAYRYARDGDTFQRSANVESLMHAAELFRRAIQADTTFKYGYGSLAAVYLEVGMTAPDAATRERARLSLLALSREAIAAQADAATVVSIEDRYRSLMLTNAFDAEAYWRSEIVKDPSNPMALTSYLRLLAGADLVAESEAYLERALSLADSQPDPSWRRALEAEYATLAFVRGDFEEAVRQLKETVVDRSPDATFSLFGLVHALARLDRFAEAEAYLTRLNSGDPLWAYGAKLMLLAERGDIPLGSSALTVALANPLATNSMRGITCFVLGDVAGGVRWWREIEPVLLAMEWNFIAGYESYWAKGVVTDPRYQALLDDLGIGRRWRTYMREKAAELTPITGIEVTTPLEVVSGPPRADTDKALAQLHEPWSRNVIPSQ